MPFNATGGMASIDAPEPGGIRDQHDPPVCHRCMQDMTREHCGWMDLEGRGRTRGKVAFIACKGWTRMRLRGTPL